MAAAVENMVVTGTDGGVETGVTALPVPGVTAAAAAAAVPPAAPAPPLRKAKTKEGKGNVASSEKVALCRVLVAGHLF